MKQEYGLQLEEQIRWASSLSSLPTLSTDHDQGEEGDRGQRAPDEQGVRQAAGELISILFWLLITHNWNWL